MSKVIIVKKIFCILFCFCLISCVSPYSATNLTDLTGKSKTQIKLSFGSPTIEHHEDNASLWVYYKNGCSSLIFFDQEGIVQHAELRGDC